MHSSASGKSEAIARRMTCSASRWVRFSPAKYSSMVRGATLAEREPALGLRGARVLAGGGMGILSAGHGVGDRVEGDLEAIADVPDDQRGQRHGLHAGKMHGPRGVDV